MPITQDRLMSIIEAADLVVTRLAEIKLACADARQQVPSRATYLATIAYARTSQNPAVILRVAEECFGAFDELHNQFLSLLEYLSFKSEMPHETALTLVAEHTHIKLTQKRNARMRRWIATKRKEAQRDTLADVNNRRGLEQLSAQDPRNTAPLPRHQTRAEIDASLEREIKALEPPSPSTKPSVTKPTAQQSQFDPEHTAELERQRLALETEDKDNTF